MRTLLRRGRHGGGTVARQFLVLRVLVGGVLVGSALALAPLDPRGDTRDRAGEQAIAVARSIAAPPAVRDALHTADPSTTLQPYAEAVRADADVDFVVVM